MSHITRVEDNILIDEDERGHVRVWFQVFFRRELATDSMTAELISPFAPSQKQPIQEV